MQKAPPLYTLMSASLPAHAAIALLLYICNIRPNLVYSYIIAGTRCVTDNESGRGKANGDEHLSNFAIY